MNTYHEREDALLHVSRMQRHILDSGVAMCYNALDQGGHDMDNTESRWSGDRYHAWAFNYHTAELQECDLSDENVVDMVELDPVDVDAAIEAEGWCGALGATYGFPFVICPLGTTTMPEAAKAFIRSNIK